MASPLWQEIRGFSLHYSEDNDQARASRRFAEILGDFMLGIGYQPNHYLADRIGFEIVDRRRGIYNRDKPRGLYMLRGVKVPAIIIEVGNIANPHDEKILSLDSSKKKIIESIKNAIAQYLEIK